MRTKETKRTKRFYRLPRVCEDTGLSKSTIYARINAGTFPSPSKLGKRAVGWPDYLIDEFLEDPAGWRDPDFVAPVGGTEK